MPERRTKMSPPPPTLPSDGDRVVLAGLVHASAYPLLLDVIQGFAIEQEVELYVNEIGSERATMELVYMARAAWLVLDRIQFRVERAIEIEAERQAQEQVSAGNSGVRTNEEILGVE